MSRRVSVANDFSRTPGARTRERGPLSGQAFREEVLDPAFRMVLNEGGHLTVDLAGTVGYATSFLEEAFGGLARAWGAVVVREHLRIESADRPHLVAEVWGYVDEVRE